jgi:hypothetical protein
MGHRLLTAACLLALLGGAAPATAGVWPSAEGPAPADSLGATPTRDSLPPPRHSPTKAAWRAAVLPGWGQVYNRKYWKLPLVYGGLGGLGYWVAFNATEHRRFREGYIAKTDGDPATVDPFPAFPAETIQRSREFYRRQMDASILLTAAFYGLQIVDAVVDAHLYEFDVGRDLTLTGQPWVAPAPGPGWSSAAGVHFSLTWK